MAIRLSTDISVLVISNLYLDYLNNTKVATGDATRFIITQDNNVIKIGNIKHNDDDYTVCIVSKENMSCNYPYVSDFLFDTHVSFDSHWDFDLAIERDLKLIKSRGTPSGFNLSEYFNGEITEDMTHYDFFSRIVDLLVEKEDEIVKNLLGDLTKEVIQHLNKLSERHTQSN